MGTPAGRSKGGMRSGVPARSSGRQVRLVQKVPLFRPTIRRRQMHAVLECLVAEEIGPGALARRLVRELAAPLGLIGGTALADEGAAIAAALQAVTANGDQPGDRARSGVLLSALAPQSYVAAARRLGLAPILVEVDADTGTLPLAALQRLAERQPQPAALVLHHPLAQLEQLEVIRELGVPIVEDVTAVVLGAVSADGGMTGRAAGGRAGEVVVVRLPPHGAITAAGGAVVMARGRRCQRFLAEYPAAHGCAQLADMNAALTLAQLPELPIYRRRCLHLATLFGDALARSRHRTLAPAAPGADPAPVMPRHLFPVVVTDGMLAVRRYATRHQIQTALAFDDSAIAHVTATAAEPAAGAAAEPPSEQETAANQAAPLRAAAELARRCVLFPMYPTLSDGAADQIARVLATLP